ncbi:MAG: 30S ribosome-binding factor RbfA [Planctomycetota bacterium]
MATERRRKQIARRIQERVAQVLLGEMKDPRMGFITVTGTEINADLSVAVVRYSVYGSRADLHKVQKMLDHARGFLRTEVARVLDLRNAPRLDFEYDCGLAQAARMEAILREVRDKPDEAGSPEPPLPPETED